MTTTDLRRPETEEAAGAVHRAGGKLEGRIALITGGDSPLSRAAAVVFAKEGADVALVHRNGAREAAEAASRVRAEGRRVLLLRGDGSEQDFCREVAATVAADLGPVDVLVNVAGEPPVTGEAHEITAEQVFRSFRGSVFSYFYSTLAALDHMRRGGAIVNVAGLAHAGSAGLVDHAAAQGAVLSFTRSLARALAGRRIRVNGVAAGPLWTPLPPSTLPPDQIADLGAGGPSPTPEEIVPVLVFLASRDSACLTGQILHPGTS